MSQIDLLVHNIKALVTMAGPAGARSGAEMKEIGLVQDGAVAVVDGRIVAVGREEDVQKQIQGADISTEWDAKGKLVTPGLVEPHTHLVHGGSREHELSLKLNGASYLEILEKGGGILSTVRATRAATEEELFVKAKKSLDQMLQFGATTVEAKSGYGLSVKEELKQLRVTSALQKLHPVDLVSTFMGAHAVPTEYKGRTDEYVALVINEMLPEVKRSGLAEFCDVFCEHGVFSVEQSRAIMQAARKLGFRLKLHADEIEPLGGAD